MVVDFLHRINAELAETGLAVESLGVTDRGAWSAVLTGGLDLQLGRQEPLARVERFAAAYQSALGNDPRRLESVDLRYPNGMAVRWGPPAELLARSEGSQ